MKKIMSLSYNKPMYDLVQVDYPREKERNESIYNVFFFPILAHT